VTGGAGFIGSHLVHRLVGLGHRVRVVDNLSTGHVSNLAQVASQIDFVEGDLRAQGVCDDVTSEIDYVFHVAAQPSVARSMAAPLASHENNVNATLFILEAARKNGAKRVIYSSSSSTYGDEPDLPKRETSEPKPKSPYAAAKLAGEQYALAYARCGLIEAVALRYFNVFGPRQDPNGPYAAVVPAIFRAAVTAMPMIIYGDGRQTRDFTYVDNVVNANVLAATLPGDRVSGHVVNVGGGQRTSLLEVVEAVRHLTSANIPILFHPARPGDVRDSLASLDRARTVLGYEPKVSLEQGLLNLWHWLREQSSVGARRPATSTG